MKKNLRLFLQQKIATSAYRRIFFSFFYLIFGFGFLAIWEFYVVKANIPRYILPKPSEIGDFLYREFFVSHQAGYEGILIKSIWSLRDAIIGFSISVIFGCILGIVFAYRKWWKAMFFPIIFITQLLPVPAFAPVVAAMFGYGLTTKIIIIVLFTIFPVIVSVEKQVTNIPRSYVSLFRIYNSSKKKMFLHLVFPSIVSALFVNLKILITASFVASIISELSVTVSHGIGKDIYTSFNNQIIPRVWSSLLIISLISIALFTLVRQLETQILDKYHYGKSE